ncbi:MFS transporter [Psychrobacter sp.]|uniref:MFS transporter n=1 Tax=Psychrobacter sp. TaxID=56811 RepID=UPI002647528F|nr:MFS transporter [Psychrobacter sp.]MDN6276864.1 MFS transporter [Psychrobacter sp.]MDN6307988.1 MFS transporter [Psychrobacter sp.]
MQLSRLGEYSLLLVAMLTIMVGAVLAPGLHTIAPALGFETYAPLLLTLPALGAILFAPLFGKLIDRFGARTTLLASLLGYFVFGMGGMFLHGPVIVVVDRIVLGAFAVGAMVAGTVLISQWYTGKARLNMIAKQGMAIELGGVIFLFLGGLLSELSWQAPFILYALAFVCVLLTLYSIPKKEPYPEVANSTINDDKTQPIAPVIAYAVLAMSLFYTMFTTLPGLLADLQFTESQTGYLLSYISLIAVFTAMIMPKVVGKYSENNTLILGFTSLAVAHGLFATSTATSALILAATFAGIGFGFSIPLLNHATVERSTERNRGHNLSLFGMAVFTGQFLTSFFEFVPLANTSILLLCAVVGGICVIYLKLHHRLVQSA